jgi:hypothetical protein
MRISYASLTKKKRVMKAKERVRQIPRYGRRKGRFVRLRVFLKVLDGDAKEPLGSLNSLFGEGCDACVVAGRGLYAKHIVYTQYF